MINKLFSLLQKPDLTADVIIHPGHTMKTVVFGVTNHIYFWKLSIISKTILLKFIRPLLLQRIIYVNILFGTQFSLNKHYSMRWHLSVFRCTVFMMTSAVVRIPVKQIHCVLYWKKNNRAVFLTPNFITLFTFELKETLLNIWFERAYFISETL